MMPGYHYGKMKKGKKKKAGAKKGGKKGYSRAK